MAELTTRETIDIERLFEMESGYVLDFSNVSFKGFVYDATGIDIYDEASSIYLGLSKANRLRSFFRHESGYLSGKLLESLIEYMDAKGLGSHLEERATIIDRLNRTSDRLVRESPIDNLDAVEPFANERSLSILVSSIRDSVRKNEPEAALDRLHTFLTKLLRDLCDKKSIPWDDGTPLHSLMGLYRKNLKECDHLQSEMTDRILGTSISLLDSYNAVRNNYSFAHPNDALSQAESSFVVSAVLNVVKFLYSIEHPEEEVKPDGDLSGFYIEDDIPF